MDRREALIVGVGAAASIAGCSGKNHLTENQSKELARSAIKQLLARLQAEGLGALRPVIASSDVHQLDQIKKMADAIKNAKESGKTERPDFDYHLDEDSVKLEGKTVSSVIRRCCGSGTYTFRLNEKNRRTYCLGRALDRLLDFDEGLETPLPTDPVELESILKDAKTLRLVKMPSGDPFVVFFGLAGHPERLELLDAKKLVANSEHHQLMFSLTGFERPVSVRAELNDEGNAISKLISLEDLTPGKWLELRVLSMSNPE